MSLPFGLRHIAIVPVRALAALQCIECAHLLAGELKVEEPPILLDAIWGGGPREHGSAGQHAAQGIQQCVLRAAYGCVRVSLVVLLDVLVVAGVTMVDI